MLPPTLSDAALELLNIGVERCFTSPDTRQLRDELPANRVGVVSDIVDSNESIAQLIWQKSESGIGSGYITGADGERLLVVDEGALIANPSSIAEWYWRQLVSDRDDGLVPTIVCDRFGLALGLVYSNGNSFQQAISQRMGVYWSRSRNEIWEKGKSSGNGQRLHQVAVDCDHDALRFSVSQSGGFCHRETYSCFGDEHTLATIESRLCSRLEQGDAHSITVKVANDSELLKAKIMEEAQELLDATSTHDKEWEMADLIYFSWISLLQGGGSMRGAFEQLAKRSRRVSRRPV
ncbi:MAG: phosphoribosyl-AMP cyclohydrolase [Pirellulaceae bacterium]